MVIGITAGFSRRRTGETPAPPEMIIWSRIETPRKPSFWESAATEESHNWEENTRSFAALRMTRLLFAEGRTGYQSHGNYKARWAGPAQVFCQGRGLAPKWKGLPGAAAANLLIPVKSQWIILAKGKNLFPGSLKAKIFLLFYRKPPGGRPSGRPDAKRI